MRRRNGSGSITKLTGNRRNPWMVRIFLRYDLNEETGKAKQIYKVLGYYPKKADAERALSKYNLNPFDIDKKNMTFEDVYNEYIEEEFKGEKTPKFKDRRTAYNNCPDWLYNKKFAELTYKQLEKAIGDSGKNYPSMRKMVNLFHMIYKYALKNDIVEKDVSQYVSISQYKDKNPNSIERKIFRKKEIKSYGNVKKMREYS